MVNESTFKNDLDELLFAFRNKEYGSYKLRKAYKIYLSIAMWISILIISLATTGSSIYEMVNPAENIIKPKDPITIKLDQPPPIEEKKDPLVVEAPPLKPTIKFTPPIVKIDELVQNEYMPTIEELKNANPDVKTKEGIDGGHDYSPDEEELVVEGEVKKPEIYLPYADELPDPIGGVKGIQEKISYPQIAKKAEVEGKVIIRAFVDETGTVTKAEIIKGIGAGCDQAALDAVLKTKFKPCRQRGNPVRVQVSIPIIFKLK
ncbi:MAG: hypothetical protein A2V93_01710 [Ignavibacteria bacterium RBG_16_34_14]|nr:MAG: hypothetical protein A2V93_01710 [Ignavibacteria bacterium RBG_16_34_14]